MNPDANRADNQGSGRIQPAVRTIRVEKYYNSIARLEAAYDRAAQSRPPRPAVPADFVAWKEQLRGKLRDALGLHHMARCEPTVVQLGSEELANCRREKWILQTEPEVWMPFYALVPRQRAERGPLPVVIATHGHRGAGKLSVAGCDEIPAIRSVIEHYHYDYGRRFCAEGYVVLCPDARGFGERREFYFGQVTNEDVMDEEFFLESSCTLLNRKAVSLGQSLAGMWTWDLMRLIDHAATRPDCDAARLACAGLSGGGLQTLWLAAMDDRVKCAVISGNFFGLRDSLISITRCSCSYVPHLCELVDTGDLGALITPRPLLIESATGDELSGCRGLQNVTEQVEITRRAYAMLGNEERFCHHVFSGSHRWDGEKTYPFVRRWL